ncbi:YchJ family protein [Neisseria leonii]|uniref:YchJ family protein n=1 Tax=Neisseria leonii TaxID=2995413 RepID=UPI0030CFD2B1
MTMPCPCGTDTPYADCCAPLHQNRRPAANAETLMRSRYSAYTLGETGYIRDTTVPAQQPLLDMPAIIRYSRDSEWLGLTVLHHIPDTGKNHARVVFEARFRADGKTHCHREDSAFVCIGGRWYFIDPTVALPAMKSPCICGSGRKFKHCCGGQLQNAAHG